MAPISRWYLTAILVSKFRINVFSIDNDFNTGSNGFMVKLLYSLTI